MKYIFSLVVFFPALIFWIGFAFCFYWANRIIKEPKYAAWEWYGVFASISPYHNNIFNFEDED